MPEMSEWLTPTEALSGFDRLISLETDESAYHFSDVFFSFRIAGLGFLVPASFHCEVVESLTVYPIPNTQLWLDGLINLRGNFVPVLDLRLLWTEASKDRSKRRLFCLDRDEKAMALWVDGFPEVESTLPKPLKQLPPLPDMIGRYVQESYSYRNQVWLHLRFEELFKTLGQQVAAL